MQTPLTEKHTHSLRLVQCHPEQLFASWDQPKDLQQTFQNIVTTLSFFREELLNCCNADNARQTLGQLKMWVRDKPWISGMVLGKVEILEDILGRGTLLFDCPQAEIVESLEMCQHIFFMEMAINDTLLI